ncbi:MAG: hypothetical protein KDB22_22125 [Planctomycetales bacterium]|nr:hypothetical protein [Planctomycetales bacterium]
MSVRVWYPQLDVYDTVRRVGLLLSAWQENPPSVERLLIADFYLANPPLIHKATMPEKVREHFRELQIPKPEKTFLSYPAAPILFHKMAPIQEKALQALIGKRMVSASDMRRGIARLSDFGQSFIDEKLLSASTSTERELVVFLTTSFAVIGPDDINELRRRTGLRRAVQ